MCGGLTFVSLFVHADFSRLKESARSMSRDNGGRGGGGRGDVGRGDGRGEGGGGGGASVSQLLDIDVERQYKYFYQMFMLDFKAEIGTLLPPPHPRKFVHT